MSNSENIEKTIFGKVKENMETGIGTPTINNKTKKVNIFIK